MARDDDFPFDDGTDRTPVKHMAVKKPKPEPEVEPEPDARAPEVFIHAFVCLTPKCKGQRREGAFEPGADVKCPKCGAPMQRHYWSEKVKLAKASAA